MMNEINNALSSSATDIREYRRFRAWELHQQGWKQKEIAQVLDVTPGAVSQWLAGHETRGWKPFADARPLERTPG